MILKRKVSWKPHVLLRKPAEDTIQAAKHGLETGLAQETRERHRCKYDVFSKEGEMQLLYAHTYVYIHIYIHI